MRDVVRLRFALLLAACSTAALFGCHEPHLAGTHDAALDYEIEADPATGARVDPRLAAAGVKARLVAARITADVEENDGGGVRVVIDDEAAGAVDSLVTWRGGLRVQRIEDGKLVEPPIVDAVAVGAKPILRGKALALTLPDDAKLAINEYGNAHPDARVALMRGKATFATMPIAHAGTPWVLVDLGDDVASYTRAHNTRRLLASPILPAMRRVHHEPLPARWGLATACLVIPFALSFAWLAFVRRFDRARPEPMWLVAATFALGGASVVPAGLVEAAADRLTPWLDPSVATLGGQLWALPLAVGVFTVVVGLSEEGAKLLATWALAKHRREFDEPVDGIVYGCAAALGFAAVENVEYFAIGRMSSAVIALRAFMTVPAHMFFGAIWGYAMGRKLVSRKTSVGAFLALAALAHGSFDAMLSVDGAEHLATLLVLVLAIAFVLMLRSALRFGAVERRDRVDADAPPATQPVPTSTLPRALFRVGSPAAFLGCAAAMIACAFFLMAVGTAYEVMQHRASVVFVVIGTALLSLFGFAAYGASETIPLDVAIDARGITFAGATTPWRDIVSFDFEPRGSRGYVRLHTRGGQVARLGPANARRAQEIYAAVAAARA